MYILFMNKKLKELFLWLQKEISGLKEMQQNVSPNSKLGRIIETKIGVYEVILEGLKK